jgi:hypothetical protein
MIEVTDAMVDAAIEAHKKYWATNTRNLSDAAMEQAAKECVRAAINAAMAVAPNQTELAATLLMPFANLISAAQAVLKYAEDMAPKPIESAPRDGTTILVWWEGNYEQPSWGTAYWSDIHNGFATLEGSGINADDLTHWLPLPPPPTQTPAVFTDLAAAVEGVG